MNNNNINNNQNGVGYYSAFNGYDQNGVNYFSGSPITYSPVTYSPAVQNILTPEINSLSPASDESVLFYQQLHRVYIEQQLQYGSDNIIALNTFTGAEILTLMAGHDGVDDEQKQDALMGCPENIDNDLWNLNADNIYAISSVGAGYMDNGEIAGNEQYHIRAVHAVVMYQNSPMVLLSLYDRAGRFRDTASYYTWSCMLPDNDGIWDASNQRLIFDFLNMNNRFGPEPNMGFNDFEFDE